MPTARDFTLTHGRIDAAGLVYLGGPKEVDEGIADGAVTPGAVLVQGTNENDVSEAGANATAVVGIALENDFTTTDPADQADTGDIDADHPWLDDFADDEPVDYAKNIGVEFRAIVGANATTDIVKGDICITDADGALLNAADGTIGDEVNLFRALEDVDVSEVDRMKVVWVK